MWMFKQDSFVTALEIGTSKVVAIIAEVNESEAINIVGFGEAKSHGVLKGEIIDSKVAYEDIRKAIREAEDRADREVHQVYLGVTGQHITSNNYTGSHAIASSDRFISEEDVDDVMSNARRFNLNHGQHMIHVIRQQFKVDGRTVHQSPIGMAGSDLAVVLHAVQGYKEPLQRPVQLLRKMKLEAENLVFNGLASALSVLSPAQKAEGALVIDLGAGTTEYAACSKGVVCHSGVLAVGGDHVTEDLSIGLECPFTRAEDLKIKFGSAVVSESARGQVRELVNEVGLTDRRVNVESLRRIMSERLKEIFAIIAAELDRCDMTDMVHSVVLCGGGSSTPEICTLASKVLELPVQIGAGVNLHGPSSIIERPEYATALGLLKFGSFDLARQRESAASRIPLKDRIKSLLRIES
ncbi:MAG: cell division protein FtsA [Verrucomicrobiota bacterium]|jgi:cell division protein FtsA